MSKRYQISDGDIEATVRFLKSIGAEHATPQIAREILETMQQTFHELSHDDPQLLIKLYNELKPKP